jgi:hypothetical protein
MADDDLAAFFTDLSSAAVEAPAVEEGEGKEPGLGEKTAGEGKRSAGQPTSVVLSYTAMMRGDKPAQSMDGLSGSVVHVFWDGQVVKIMVSAIMDTSYRTMGT